MFSRLITVDKKKSFFLFGPRGVGKSTWLRQQFPSATFIDLLADVPFIELSAQPSRIENYIAKTDKQWVVIDEIQRVPALLNEVHRLIETRGILFALTGSSARKLRAKGVNLLAGRALTRQMFGLTANELGERFSLQHALEYGCLPSVYVDEDPKAYLKAYVHTYVREEVLQEGITRNLAAFGRFLAAATFSQASVLNIAGVARECSVERKTVEGYFTVLEDLLLALRVEPFTRKAKRRLVSHPKFFFFDPGVYRALRPRGPLDEASEIEGAALETLVLNHLRAHNAYFNLDYSLHYWRSATGLEVDFVLYGERGLRAIEVKRTVKIRPDDLKGLQTFREDYSMAECTLLYLGERTYHEGHIKIMPLVEFLRTPL